MRILELFAGSKSIGKAATELGHEVFSSDFIEKFETDYTVDIWEFDLNKLPWKPDVIWASPPCTGFSVAAIGRNWNMDRTPKTETARLGIELVKKTPEIIDILKPKYWYIENPRGMLRKLDLIGEGIRHTVTYCQYGDTRQKPTDIWTNNENWKPKPICKPGASCHVAAPRGSRTGTQGLKGDYERSRIPHRLCIEIIKSCE